MLSGQDSCFLDCHHLLHLAPEEHLLKEAPCRQDRVTGMWGLRPRGFSCLPGWAGPCELQRSSFFCGLQPRLERDLSDVSVHATLSLGSILVFCLVLQGWEHLWEAMPGLSCCTTFLKWNSSGLREVAETWMSAPGQVCVSYLYKSSVPWCGTPVSSAALHVLIHIGRWHLGSLTCLRAKVVKTSPTEV